MCHGRPPRHSLFMGNDTLHVVGGLAGLATAFSWDGVATRRP